MAGEHLNQSAHQGVGFLTESSRRFSATTRLSAPAGASMRLDLRYELFDWRKSIESALSF